MNLWPSKGGSQAAAADPRRLDALRRAEVAPDQQRKEHHELERHVLFAELGQAS